ncbi:serine/threonine-protein kinase [Streptomyces sp. NPDC056224]|uniref:serine/threonine-protein kinase n=1 Tax=Streptomyces sp. NPDC056224 TaxID=3345750 RepID=UPI0035DB5A65
MRDQLLGGRYRLVRQLGEGAMGQVWEALDETLCRPVAVKVISLLAGGGSRGNEARARFLREARITAQLQHPNIVTIHDLGEAGTEDNKAPFLVMELIRGEGLDAMLRRGAVPLPDTARWGAQICDALAAAHDMGVMHRDIKPSNILITASGLVKVLDFGIARAADPYATADRLTQTGFIVGTPPYMAPEQARGFPEPRSDQYALGCLLFELITGRLPFQAPDTVGYLSAHLTQEPPAPSSLTTGIPSAWDELLLTLLDKDPDKRYPNAADLSRALRRLDHAPELAPPEPDRPHLPTGPGTTPPPPVVSTPGANKVPPRPGATSASPARLRVLLVGLDIATRFVLPAVLFLLFNWLIAAENRFGLSVAMAVISVLTAVLTSRSTKLTRGTGYAAAAVIVVGLVVDVIDKQGSWAGDGWFDGVMYRSHYTLQLLFHAVCVLTIATYRYRDVKTRRALSDHGMSDSDNTSTP